MSLYLERIEEQIVPGRRLGRHVHHDSRSLQYLVDVADVPLVSKTWARSTPILDQGDLGSCTGNAAAGCLGTEPFIDTLDPTLVLDENEARRLYSEATVLDSFPGDYPPDDTGSDGLSVAKACKNDGLIVGYQHATSFDAMAAALQTAPVIMGLNWYGGFDTPDANGLVAIGKRDTVRGGHEICVRGIDVENELIHADNSWSASWGLHGSFSFSFADCTRLLGEDGDCTAFVPLTEPAPTPTPVPVPTDADAVLKAAGAKFWKAYKRWEQATASTEGARS